MLPISLALVTLPFAALPLAAGGNFVASLHSNFVVNLDFEGDAQASDGAEAAPDVPAEDVKVMAFAGGERKFRCRLPSPRNSSQGATPQDADKTREHFLAAKLAPLRGQCWKLTKDYWSYDVCFGRRAVQYRPGSDARFSLGEHVAEADELLPDGGVRELYTGGTDNRTLELRYVCGSSEANLRTFTLEETRPLFYTVIVSGPAFCRWQDKEGTEAHDAQGKKLLVSSLLEEFRGGCVNLTEGWWTYEYCYPRNLVQYHLQGRKRDPEHVLGTMSNSDARLAPDTVDMGLVRLRPSISPRERRAPPSGHWTLRQRLTGGTVCDETGRARMSHMHFQCPPNWQSRPEPRIVSISEGSLCEYEVLIHTTLLCGHPKLMPTLPRGKETIQCVAEPRPA